MRYKDSEYRLVIIAPSSYGDQGELLQYYRILMKTSVHTVLRALVEQAAKRWQVCFRITVFHERLEPGDAYLRQIMTMDKRRTLVFITAKSFELPRAIDIGMVLRRSSFSVVLGGPGVTLTDWRTYAFLAQQGISFNVGEGEYTVGQIIEDFLNHRLKPIYWQQTYVDLREAPLPTLPEPNEHRHCLNPLVGFSTSEGCPFDCSFCCVTTLRGKRIAAERARDPEAVVDWIERVHRLGHSIMLTDDNVRRSFHYETLKEKLIRLNERLNRKLKLLVQVDVSKGIKQEIPDLARMGVIHAFVGMESLDPAVLAGISKGHNKPDQYQSIANAFRKHEILVNSGVIVGFPSQDTKSILQEIKGFTRILDLISIFCASPFPGSQDYKQAITHGTLITHDPNFYDTRHVCRDWFEKMTPAEAERAYHWASLMASTLRHRFYQRSKQMRWRNFRSNTFNLAMGFWGYVTRGYPYIFMMDGIPRTSTVSRPRAGFKGFVLNHDDLKYKTTWLERFGA